MPLLTYLSGDTVRYSVFFATETLKLLLNRVFIYFLNIVEDSSIICNMRFMAAFGSGTGTTVLTHGPCIQIIFKILYPKHF
jgi:hypothetical protein